MKLIQQISNVKDFSFFEDELYVLYKNRRINNLDNSFYSLKLMKGLIVDYGLVLYDLVNKVWIERTSQGYSPIFFVDEQLLCKKVDSENETVRYYLYDISSKQYLNLGVDIAGAPIFALKSLIYTREELAVNCYTKGFKKWTVKIDEFFNSSDSEKGTISEVLLGCERIIILSNFSVVIIDAIDGSILNVLKLETWQSRGIVQDNFLYTTSNAYINKVDIITGKVSYQTPFDYININGKKDLNAISELIWYNNSIWTTMDTSPNALIELDPETGSYKNIYSLLELDITRDCHPPKFHNDWMYLLDFDNTLHIFSMQL